MNRRKIWILWISVAVLLFLQLSDVAAFSGFQRSLNDRPWGVVSVTQPVRAGLQAQRFELRAGDCGSQPGWSDCATDRERTEFSQLKPYIAQGQDIWVSYSIMLDPTWPDISPVTTTLGQFHHRDSTRPAVLFVQRNGGYWLRIESARSLYPGRDLYPLKSLDVMRGVWTDIVIHARFSQGQDGILRVWVDGEQRVNLLGANTRETTPVFFKYGVYRSFVSRRPDRGAHIVYWDEVRSGPNRRSVDPRINPRLTPIN